MNHVSLPKIFYVYVPNNLLGPNMPSGFTRGILHGIYARESQAILTNILLESGAHWSGIPLHLLTFEEKLINNKLFSQSDLQPWGAMGTELSVSNMMYLNGLRVKMRMIEAEGRHTGIIIDWKDGFSIYPQEHKPLSMIHLDNGQIAAIPNNYFTIEDPHFTVESELTKFYKRGEVIYWEK